MAYLGVLRDRLRSARTRARNGENAVSEWVAVGRADSRKTGNKTPVIVSVIVRA